MAAAGVFNPISYAMRLPVSGTHGSRVTRNDCHGCYLHYNLGANSPVGRSYFATTGEPGLPIPRPGQFRGGLLGSITRTFWGQPVPPGEKRQKYHVPLAGDIAQTSADLLFSKAPVVESRDPGNQAAFSRLMEDGLHSTLLEAGELCSALGGVYLRVVWDTDLSDFPWIDVVPADAAVPHFSYNKLVAVTFWRVLYDSGPEVVRHLETHIPSQNAIQHSLYSGDQSDLGRVLPLTDFPETAQFSQFVSNGDTIEFPDQPLDAATVVYIPNQRPNRIWRDLGPQATPLGRSDYSGVEGLMDALDEDYCVDMGTEILTDHGWVTCQELRTGDSVLTLNHESGMSEWQPVQAVNVFPAKERDMISLESRSHSSLTTLDHRWPVERPHFRHEGAAWGKGRNAYKKPAGLVRTWATSATVQFDDRVQLAAECADLPEVAKYGDALVEAVAWFWTEGHIRKLRDGTPGPNIMLGQATVDTANCARIRSALWRAFGPDKGLFPRMGRGKDPVPRWREDASARITMFHINAAAGKILQDLAPNRVPSHAFLLSLTRAQLALFIEASLLADRSSESMLAQKDPAAAEAFQFACILAGHPTSLKPGTTEYADRTGAKYHMTQVRIRSQRLLWPGRAAWDQSRRGKSGVRKIVRHSGEVWCPTTPNGTWLARRNGTVWFTGNSSWQRDIILAKSRLIVPQQYLDNIGRGKGAVFDPDREIYSPINMLTTGGGTNDILANQFKIRFQEHQATCGWLINQIVRGAGYSGQTFGEYDAQGSLTATEVQARERRSLITREKKVLYWRKEVRDIMYGLLTVQREVFGDRSINPERPNVTFVEPLPPDQLELAQTAQAMSVADAASKETLVRTIHPDWTPEQVKIETDQIFAELGTSLIGRARITLPAGQPGVGPDGMPTPGPSLSEDIQELAQPVTPPEGAVSRDAIDEGQV